MTLKKISELSAIVQIQTIKLIATDIDGTLTRQGMFTNQLLSTLERLKENQVQVLLITGRSAGWCQGIVNYLPVFGIIAENGGVYCLKQSQAIKPLTSLTNLSEHRQALKNNFEYLQKIFPNLQPSTDNQFRLTDWTFDCHELNKSELLSIEKICQENHWGFTYSHIQGHLKPLQQNKANGLKIIRQNYFRDLSWEQIVTVGDSLNDESLFNEEFFSLSVGVANILNYRERLKYQPVYVTNLPEIDGFCELAQLLIGE